jgi:Sec-independent protein secretion pathway component TatC
VLFPGGIAFCYFVILPPRSVSRATTRISTTSRSGASYYLSFVALMTFFTGLVFSS